MKNKLKLTLNLILGLVMLISMGSLHHGFLYSQEEEPPIDVDEVLVEIDDKLNFGFGSDSGSFSANVSIIHKEPDGEKKLVLL